MNNKQEQFLNYILKRVQDGKVDEAQALINENFKKQEAGTFTRADIGEFIPKITMLIKPNHVDEVHNVIQEFAATFSKNKKLLLIEQFFILLTTTFKMTNLILP